MEYLKALRLPAGIFIMLMTFASFSLSGRTFIDSVCPGIVSLLLFCATCVWNDFFNREHDALAGKDFVKKNCRKFGAFANAVWLMALISAIPVMFHQGDSAKFIVLAMYLLGYGYNLTNNTPGLSLLTVSFCCALPMMLPLSYGSFHYAMLSIALFVFLVMIPRENDKDITDIQWDLHPVFGKETLPVALGINQSLIIATISQILSLCFIVVGIAWMPALLIKFLLAAAALFMISSTLTMHEYTIKRSQLLLDIGLGIIAITLGIIWPMIKH